MEIRHETVNDLFGTSDRILIETGKGSRKGKHHMCWLPNLERKWVWYSFCHRWLAGSRMWRPVTDVNCTQCTRALLKLANIFGRQFPGMPYDVVADYYEEEGDVQAMGILRAANEVVQLGAQK